MLDTSTSFGPANALTRAPMCTPTPPMSSPRTERFGNELLIGTGINTGVVIAGTIGGGSKLEFTLIGDTVNVAARVEQLTKTTGGAILLTQQSVDALVCQPTGLLDRGLYAVKGKSAAVQVFGLDTNSDLSD